MNESLNGDTLRAECISKVRIEIEKEQRGAFAPLHQNPVLGALALPSSSVLFGYILEFLDRLG